MVNIVILAAGQGKRMQSDLPKVLHPIAGQAMVMHVIDHALTLQPTSISIVIGHGAHQVRQHIETAYLALANKHSVRAPLSFSLQNPPQGTGHAVMQALPSIDPQLPTLVLYGDVPLVQTRTMQQLVASAAIGVLTLLTQTVPSPTGYGRIVRNAGGDVQAIVEEKDATPDQRAIQEINTGLMCIPAGQAQRWLPQLTNQNAQREYYLTDIVGLAVRDGVTVTALQPTFDWEVQGVNDQLQRASLERQYQLHQAHELMRAGVHLADPSRLDIRGQLTVGRGVVIDIGCIFEGQVVLGDNVVIGPHCVLRNVTIGNATQVLAYSHLDESRIGCNAQLGPYARLRPGTVLADETRIGNFVEVKNSSLGRASKANHLAYVGDAVVGERVNISAGVITANYDGVNKHKTNIGDDAFVGSDVTLIAPLTVANGSYIAAGSTINKPTIEGKLTIARAKQLTIDGWKRPTKK